MKPDKMTVYDLFQRERRYVVPLYQRPYVWTEEDQWEPLWGDIEGKARAALAGRRTPPHFLGAIVLSPIQVGSRQISASQIIDGQQRLTTLQIFLAALRDYVAALKESAEGDERSADDLGHLGATLRQITEHSNFRGGPEERFKVWPTNGDRDVFEATMSAGSLATLDARFPIVTRPRARRPEPGPRLVEAYRYFHQRIVEMVTSHEEPLAPLDALYEALKQHLQLVVIDLEEDDDPQVIFETLNARGVPLLPSDLIRNLVFTRVGADADALYERFWQDLDINEDDGTPGFWKQEMKIGRTKRPRIDLFFYHFLDSRRDHVIPISQLFAEFRHWWSDQSHLPRVDALAHLRRYSDTYRTFLEPKKLRASDPRLADFTERIAALDISTHYPLLLFLAVDGKEQLAPGAFMPILDDLESFIVRRVVTGAPTKNYNRFFTSLLSRLRPLKTIDPATFRALLADGGRNDTWPTDDDFRSAWLDRPLYHHLYAASIEAILRALNQKMLTRRHEVIELPPKLTIEHVMPRAWRAHWPLPTVEGATPEALAERRDRLVDTLGNLTLITGELNSTIQHAPFADKKPHLTKESLLALNTYFQDLTAWDEAAIIRRGEALFELALKIWPGPPAPKAK